MKAKWLSLACAVIALGISALVLPTGTFASWLPNSSSDLPGVAVQTSQIESLYGGVPTNFNQCIVGTACIGSRPDSVVCVSPCNRVACTQNGSGTCGPCSGVNDSTCSGPFTGVSCTQYRTSCCTTTCCCIYISQDGTCVCLGSCPAVAIGIHQYC